ncbi:blast:ATP-binding cassette sub-family C member 9, partial [Drosophila guanche]
VLAYFAVVVVYLGGFKAAKFIHNNLLYVIIRGSVCRFFDVTPIGRLLNSFSGDMEIVDEELPATLDSFMTFIWMVFAQIYFYLNFSSFIRPVIILMKNFWFVANYYELWFVLGTSFR